MSKNKLYLACKEGDIETLWNLKTKGLNIANIVKKNRQTSYYLKLARKYPDIIHFLLEWENNLDDRLYWAVKKHDLIIIEACVRLGAKIRISKLSMVVYNDRVNIIKALGSSINIACYPMRRLLVRSIEMMNALLPHIPNLHSHALWRYITPHGYFGMGSLIQLEIENRSILALLAINPKHELAKIPMELFRSLSIFIQKRKN